MQIQCDKVIKQNKNSPQKKTELSEFIAKFYRLFKS